MKIKTAGRIGGLIETAASSFFGYGCLHRLIEFDYSALAEFMLADYIPNEYKIVAGASLGTLALGVPALSLTAIDGIVDMAKGTHHYFGTTLWKKIIKNEETKKKIEKEHEQMFSVLDRPI